MSGAATSTPLLLGEVTISSSFFCTPGSMISRQRERFQSNARLLFVAVFLFYAYLSARQCRRRALFFFFH